MAEFVEALHPRDEQGRWAFKGGSGGWLIDQKDRAEIGKFKSYTNPGAAVEAVRSGALDDRVRAELAERTMLREYALGRSDVLNKSLRAGQSVNALGSVLDDMMARSSLSQDVMLYRVMGDGMKQKLSDLSPGDVLRDKAFISTSAAPLPHRDAIKIMAPAGSRAVIVKDYFNEMNEVILDRGSALEYVGEDDDGSRIFRLQQDSKAESQSLNLRSKGSATAKLQEYSSAGEKALLTDVTGFESEGIIGFLTPDGRAYNTQDEHARVAKEAGTSLDALLEEGTFRVYANGSDTLGIEAHVAPTKQQVAELIKMARAGSYDRFVIDTQGAVPADFQKFEGHVTPKAVRDTIDRTFATLHLTSSFKTDADLDQVNNPALHAFDPGQNEFLRIANDTKTAMDVYKDGHFWKQAGPQEEVEQQASRAVVELGGTEREMLAVIGIGDNERRVAFQAGEESNVSPSYDVYAMLGQDRTATYKAIHNHPLPYTLSNGDIGWLNSMVQVKAIREEDMDGGWSEATIPGREKGEYVQWPGLGSQLMDYNDRVGSDASYRASGPIARVRRQTGNSKEAVNGRTFLQQHAEMLGLHAAEIINYSYKLSPWQQGWVDKYKKEFNETVQIATDHAMKLKDFLHHKETWVANKNELWPK